MSSRIERKRLWESMTRQGILEGVVRVLGSRGLQGLTMDNVAEEAGVAKGTLYLYFKSKQDLLNATKEAALGPMIREHLSYFDTHSSLFRVLLYDRGIALARWKRYRAGRYNAFLSRLAEVLAEGSRSGIFRSMDSGRVAAMLLEADIAVIHQRLQCEHPGPVEDDANLVAGVFLHGIAEESLPKKKIS
jgi:AcrR family transcriptional regulator